MLEQIVRLIFRVNAAGEQFVCLFVYSVLNFFVHIVLPSVLPKAARFAAAISL